jgi:hypothetical protein
MADRVHAELNRMLPQKAVVQKSAGREPLGDDRIVFEFPVGHPAPEKVASQLQKSDGHQGQNRY